MNPKGEISSGTDAKTWLGTLLLSTAMLFQASAATNIATLHPIALESSAGSHEDKPITVLSDHEPLNSEAAGRYIALKPNQGRYFGQQEFALPQHIKPEQITGIRMKVNFRVECTDCGTWRWFLRLGPRTIIPVGKARRGSDRWSTFVADIPVNHAMRSLLDGQLSLVITGERLDTRLYLDYEHVEIQYEDRREKPLREWTVIAYMSGDSDLESAIVPDLEHEFAFNNRDIGVVAMADRTRGYSNAKGDWKNTLLFLPKSGMKATRREAVESWGETNTGDPKTLIRLIKYAKQHLPAKRYLLVFWGHGWHWRPGGTMEDRTSNDALDPDEIDAALTKTGPVDVLAFDSCFMANLEALSLFRKHAKYAVVSEEASGLTGIEYERVFALLQQQPNTSPRDVATMLSKTLRDYTASAIDLGTPFAGLLQTLDLFSRALLAALPQHRKEISLARTNTFSMDDKRQRDLGSIAFNVAKRFPNTPIEDSARALVDSLFQTVLFSWADKYPKKPDATGAPPTWLTWVKRFGSDYWDGYREAVKEKIGLSIFWPRTKNDFDDEFSPEDDFEYYKRVLPSSHVTHWDEFIEDFANPAISVQNAVRF